MSEIKRIGWHGVHGMQDDANGDYVLHSDHETVVDSMTAALVKLDGACLASEQEVGRLRAELADAHAAIQSKAGWEWKKESDRLRAEDSYQKMLLEQAKGTILNLRAEVEWIRSWLPAMKVLVSAVEEEFCSELTEASEPDNSKVSYPEEDCPITFGMIREARKAVDYAMGASA